MLIGEVMGKNKSYPGDRFFPAGDYDHIYYIELGDGVERPIPFNNHDNPLMAAELFVARESISRANIE